MTNEVYPQSKPHTNKTVWNEDRDVFPHVRQWLRGLGYKWREQVYLDGKYADVIARHPVTGEEMIVEVKGRYQDGVGVIRQINHYAAIYNHPDAILVIALPTVCAGHKLRTNCAELGIKLVMIDMEQPLIVVQPVVEAPPESKGLLTNEERMEIMEQLAKHRPDLLRLYSEFLSTLLAHQSQSQEPS